MKLPGLMLEHWSPHLLIAAATFGLFIGLGVLVFAAILFENWYEARKQRQEQRAFERRRQQAGASKADENFILSSTAKAS